MSNEPLPPPSTLRLAPGCLFAERYEIVEMLGQGGMGAVYRAVDRELHEEIALKVLKPELADAEGALERFRREVKLARRVTHPNVARTFDLGFQPGGDRDTSSGVRFLTMELIAGEPLSRRIGAVEGAPTLHRKLPLAEALRIAADVARGLGAAHAVGVVHRDLKPDNIMCAARRAGSGDLERVVITDFGIARLAEGIVDAALATQTVGLAIGTPAYMAPEQLEARELDGRADIYALGIVLYEMLTGELPFKGETIYALAAARLTGAVPDPRAIDPSIPEPVTALIRDAMARRREDRPDAQRLLQRLEALRGGAMEGLDRGARGPISSVADPMRMTPAGPRVAALIPLSFDDASRVIAGDLTTAIGDAIATLQPLRIVAATVVRAAMGPLVRDAVDVVALGRTQGADLVIDGALRESRGRVRGWLRIVDVTSGLQAWAERFEGAVDDPFAIEDAVVSAVTDALRARLGDAAGRRLPASPEARTIYEQARTEYAKFGVPHNDKAVVLLRELNAKFPHDPLIMSALGAALTRKWLLTGAIDREMIAEAEEVSLRALAIDSTIGETYNTIGILRLQHGEMRASLRAFHEALSRAPLLAEAHGYVGRLLCECGHVEEGLRRLDLSMRLEPQALPSVWERARTLALIGDRAGAEATIERGVGIGGPIASVPPYARFVMWWKDRALAARVVRIIDEAGEAGMFAKSLMSPILDAFAKGLPIGDVLAIFRNFADDSSASPRQRSFFYQLTTEYFCLAEDREQAIAALEQAASLPLIDLLWFDRCPALDVLREDPRFARARAITAVRAAEIWS